MAVGGLLAVDHDVVGPDPVDRERRQCGEHGVPAGGAPEEALDARRENPPDRVVAYDALAAA